MAEAKLVLTKCAHQITEWAAMPEIVEAVEAQNGTVDIEKIKDIDSRWSTDASLGALQQDLLSNNCAVSLRRLMGADPQMQYLEAVVTDVHGGLVCMSSKASDYWQGDEVKWVRAFNEGRGAMYIGPMTEGESLEQPLVQLAVPVRRDSRVIGVLMVGKTVHGIYSHEKVERRDVSDPR